MVSLQIYVAEHCQNCRYSIELASEAEMAFPEVHIEIIDLDQPNVDQPTSVFATPTFLLNGNVAWLGNPGRHELFDRLSVALADDS